MSDASVSGSPAGTARWGRAFRFRAGRDGLDAPPSAIYRWDLDKTYLRSDFESLRKMVRVPFERAEDKVDEPGVVALIRALKASAREEGRTALVHFITASPPQIGRAIREKLALDGVDVDDIVFKDQLHHLVRGHFRYLREQVGFKLAELLKARLAAPAGSIEFLFGDDWESDPLIYSLYADLVAGRLEQESLGDALVRLRIDPARLVEIKTLSARIRPHDPVRRIFINLERRTPPGRFRAFGSRLVPTFNYFQTALMLYHDGMLPLAYVAAVGRSLIDCSAYTREQLRNSLDDLSRRGYLPPPEPDLRLDLEEIGVLPADGAAARWSRRFWRRLRHGRYRRHRRRASGPPPAHGRIDYPRLVDAWITHGGGGPGGGG